MPFQCRYDARPLPPAHVTILAARNAGIVQCLLRRTESSQITRHGCGLRYRLVRAAARPAKAHAGLLVRQFCIGSEYHDPASLSTKLAREDPRMLGTEVTVDDLRGAGIARVGGTTLAALRSQLRASAADTHALRQEMTHVRERELIDQLTLLKSKQQVLRAQTAADADEVGSLMAALAASKERDLRARMERERVKSSLAGVEKERLRAVEEDKRRELAQLAQQRDALAEREHTVLDQIAELERSLREQEKHFRNESSHMEQKLMERQRARGEAQDGGAAARLAAQARTAKQMQLAQERGERAAALRAQREALEAQRLELDEALRQRVATSAGEHTEEAAAAGVAALLARIADGLPEQERRVQSLRESHAREMHVSKQALRSGDLDLASLRPQVRGRQLLLVAALLLGPNFCLHARVRGSVQLLRQLQRVSCTIGWTRGGPHPPFVLGAPTRCAHPLLLLLLPLLLLHPPPLIDGRLHYKREWRFRCQPLSRVRACSRWAARACLQLESCHRHPGTRRRKGHCAGPIERAGHDSCSTAWHWRPCLPLARGRRQSCMHTIIVDRSALRATTTGVGCCHEYPRRCRACCRAPPCGLIDCTRARA